MAGEPLANPAPSKLTYLPADRNCPLLCPELVILRDFMPDEIFRRGPLDDPFSILLAAEIGDQSRNLLLLVQRLIRQSRQALASQTILARDLIAKYLHEPISFWVFGLIASQCRRGCQRKHTEQSDPEHSPIPQAGMRTSCPCFARRAKSLRKNVTLPMASLLCMGLFSTFLVPAAQAAPATDVAHASPEVADAPRRRSIHPTDDFRKMVGARGFEPPTPSLPD